MAQTHEVSVNGGVLTKRYRLWDRAEPEREWSTLVAASAVDPDLVPRPIESGLDAHPPFVRMTVVRGVPLSGTLSSERRAALEVALRRLWSVPADGLRPTELPGLDDMSRIHHGPTDGSPVARVVEEARAAVLSWWERAHDIATADDGDDPVMGHGDPNLANYLWDGRMIRVVDFEDAGQSTVALELARLVEHLASRASDWAEFLGRFRVPPRRVTAARVLFATQWFDLLLPGGAAAARNPPGTVDVQARRMMTLIDRL